MGSIFVFLIFTGSAVVSITATHHRPPIPCIFYSCTTDYDPVCGKQLVDGCWEYRIFTNHCHMLSANSCGKANYEPCVKNKCEKPTKSGPK